MKSAALPKAVAAAFKHCQEAVRTGDWENYMASLFLPPFPRHATWAIRAFNVEVASIRDHIKGPGSAGGTIPGRMRIQFWRDAIADMYKEADLEDQQYHTIAELEKYGENTASSLLYLQLESAGIKSTKIDHLASHIGKTQAITTLLRSTPYHVTNRKMCIPSEVMAKHKVSSEEVFRQGPSKPFNDAVFDVATVAHNHLSTARAHWREMEEVNPVVAKMMLPAVPCDLFLGKLEKVGFDVFDRGLAVRNWKVPFSLWYRHRGGTF
ncbi:hypothetical protein HDU67_001045 [Dinochytrium kinnereticum]|nr:hypothetical protein HDU67_001045 [Dinochytrium kinnereticum]